MIKKTDKYEINMINELLKICEKYIVPVCEIFKISNEFFIVMPQADNDLWDYFFHNGESIFNIKNKNHHIILMQVFDIVKELHSNGFSHFDLKWENFLIFTKEKDIKIRLCDFQFTKQVTKIIQEKGCYKFMNQGTL